MNRDGLRQRLKEAIAIKKSQARGDRTRVKHLTQIRDIDANLQKQIDKEVALIHAAGMQVVHV